SSPPSAAARDRRPLGPPSIACPAAATCDGGSISKCPGARCGGSGMLCENPDGRLRAGARMPPSRCATPPEGRAAAAPSRSVPLRPRSLPGPPPPPPRPTAVAAPPAPAAPPLGPDEPVPESVPEMVLPRAELWGAGPLLGTELDERSAPLEDAVAAPPAARAG